MAAITRFTIESAPGTDPKRSPSTFYRSPFLVNAISDMTPTKDGKGDRFSVSFQDVIDVVFGHKPLFSSNHIKFSRVFFEDFILSLGQFHIYFKGLNSTNLLYFCFSDGTGLRLLLHRTPHDAQHLDPQHLHRCRSRHPCAPCLELQPCLLHQGHAMLWRNDLFAHGR